MPVQVNQSTMIAQDVLTLLRKMFKKRVALHEPVFEGNEWKYVKECLDTGWVSSSGAFVSRFEEDLARITGAKRAVAVVNGTAALHLALMMAGVEKGDEVLVPDLSFVAVSNAVTYCGAIPHFVDSDFKTLGVNPEKLAAWLQEVAQNRKGVCFNKKTGCRIKALVAVHTFGHPVDLDKVLLVCRRFGIELIEDAAEAIGSLYKGKHVGQWGRFAVMSFNGNKTVTTGGGGAILTRDAKEAKHLKHLTTTAKKPHPWLFEHDEVGFNYRLPNLNAALGCAQLERLPLYIERKRALAAKYLELFASVKGLRFFTEPNFSQSNYWLNLLLLDKESEKSRDTILSVTNEHGFMTRPSWSLAHRFPMFKDCPRMNVSDSLSLEKRIINIPSSPFL
jgi:perosamine synthetase